MRRAWLLALTLLLSGCADLGYLGQSVSGHLRLMHAAEPVSDWLDKPDINPQLRARLVLSQQIRDYATRALALPDNKSYRSYADLHRSAAVWNVVAAPPLSLTLRTWCYPVMGCVGYRGYFDKSAAETLGATLREQGLDVFVYPVPAYSTLGWTADPLLNTFIHLPEGELARMVFHELAHEEAYAKGDTAFNEAYATSVERMGSAQWLRTHAGAAAAQALARDDALHAHFQAVVGRYQAQLSALYASPLSGADKAAEKARLFAALRAEGADLPEYSAWFAQANNASIAIFAAYDDLVPAFEALFEREGRDWPRFHAEVRRLADLPFAQRHAALENAHPGEK